LQLRYIEFGRTDSIPRACARIPGPQMFIVAVLFATFAAAIPFAFALLGLRRGR
jgi:hypothetical protein